MSDLSMDTWVESVRERVADDDSLARAIEAAEVLLNPAGEGGIDWQGIRAMVGHGALTHELAWKLVEAVVATRECLIMVVDHLVRERSRHRTEG